MDAADQSKMRQLLSHISEQVEKEQYLNAASSITDLLQEVLALLSKKLKSK